MLLSTRCYYFITDTITDWDATTRAPQFPPAAHLCEVADANARKWEPYLWGYHLGCPAVDAPASRAQ